MKIFFTSDVVPAAPPEIVDSLDEVRRRSMSPENALRALDTITGTDVMDLLPKVSAPTLVLQPKRGSSVSIATAREVAAAIPKARLVLLEADNHIIQEYEPGWRDLLEETWRFLGVESSDPPHSQNGHGAPLSPREREVLALIATGRTNAEIGEALTISRATASRHVHNILEKLGMSRRGEAAAWWSDNGHPRS